MNLKEAFRFQNKLGSLMEEAQGILSRDEYAFGHTADAVCCGNLLRKKPQAQRISKNG